MGASFWQHALCWECWERYSPPGASPNRHRGAFQRGGATEKCCGCGNVTNSGIYKRAHPDTDDLWCEGTYGHHA